MYNQEKGREFNMEKNAGWLIQVIAFIEAAFGVAASWIYGINLMTLELVGTGFVVLICGSLGSVVVGLLMYGFGQLVYNSNIMVKLQDKNNDNVEKLVNSEVKTEKTRKSPVAVEVIKVDGIDISDYYETAKQKTENIKDKQRRALVMGHKDWARNVEKSKTKDLCETLDEIDEWDEDFVTLTCLEIVYRAENRNTN